MAESRVDAHHHVWSLARGDYAWLTPSLAPIYRDFSLADLMPLAQGAGIVTSVLVQAAPTIAETKFLLDVAHNSDGFVRGVVGWVDLAAPDAVAMIESLALDPLFKSVRPMLQEIPDESWILRDDVQHTLSQLPSLGVRFDALVKPAQLAALIVMIERNPDLDVVIDHGAKPAISTGAWRPWADQIRLIATSPRVHCKLSGLATEAASNWTVETLRPYVEHLFDCFGARRMLWGSDWPVVELGGGYARWQDATTALLASFTDAEQNGVRGNNARRFYGLGNF
ncbi:MAG TPA: amidohydrolase family protein [Casimicrobiaceae bacterium]|jgi:L-fuconolactonase